ncbi:MAG: ABC-2 transporter permease [Candidatus Lokiarchaeota archaeon]|nr:ABC-2 transporter permease [Candidatus Lokiarchaeota archaeon]
MSYRVLFFDELKGFYKSKIMIILWIGMPALSILIHYLIPSTEGFPVSSLVAVLVSNISGMLSSAMISTSIANEKNNHVYDLILMRPVKRYNILLSKFCAVYLCLIIATVISLALGLIIDILTIGVPSQYFLEETFKSLTISLSAMAISCSIGTFFGVSISSIAAAAILSVYVGNQVSAIATLPVLFIESLNSVLIALLVAIPLTFTFLIISLVMFSKKQF